jgi:hypothetical protein
MAVAAAGRAMALLAGLAPATVSPVSTFGPQGAISMKAPETRTNG